MFVLQDVLSCPAVQDNLIKILAAQSRTGLTGRAVPQRRTTGQDRTKKIVLWQSLVPFYASTHIIWILTLRRRRLSQHSDGEEYSCAFLNYWNSNCHIIESPDLLLKGKFRSSSRSAAGIAQCCRNGTTQWSPRRIDSSRGSSELERSLFLLSDARSKEVAIRLSPSTDHMANNLSNRYFLSMNANNYCGQKIIGEISEKNKTNALSTCDVYHQRGSKMIRMNGDH